MHHKSPIWGIPVISVFHLVINKNKEAELQSLAENIKLEIKIKPIMKKTGRILHTGVYTNSNFAKLFEVYTQIDDSLTAQEIARFGVPKRYNPKLVEICPWDPAREGLIEKREEREKIPSKYTKIQLNIKQNDLTCNFEKLQEIIKFCLF